MSIELTLPELGENIETATIGRLLVAPGDRVEIDQGLAEIETEKATAEVPSTHAGTVAEIRVKAGDQVSVGAVLVVLEADDAPAEAAVEPEEPSAAEPPTRAPEPLPAAEPDPDTEPLPATEPDPDTEPLPAAEPAPAPEPGPAPASPPETDSRPSVGSPARLVPAAPHVRRLARELGVDIASVPGTGPGRRITRDDVKAFVRRGAPAASAAIATGEPKLPDFTAWGEVRREPMSTIRKKTAENLSRSWRTVPHVTQCDEADVTRLEELRRRFAPRAEAREAKLTITAIVLRAAAGALRAFPEVNASVDMAASEIVYKEYVNLGVAVDTPKGLLVPVVRDADEKSIVDLAVELTDLSARARAGKLALEEMQGGTFTVSNLGGLGTTHFSPIVNWPEVAILGVGRATERLGIEDDEIVRRSMLPLSLSYDHRLIDGAGAARFLRWIAEALEEPAKLVFE